jgi:hypothetical protein
MHSPQRNAILHPPLDSADNSGMATPASVAIFTPLDAHTLRVAPFGDVDKIYTAVQLTLGDETGNLHAVTVDDDAAIEMVQMILNRLHEAGDARATRIVNILRAHYDADAGEARETYRQAA